MLVKLGKFQLYSSILSYLLIFWHVYNGFLRFTAHFKEYLSIKLSFLSKTDCKAEFSSAKLINPHFHQHHLECPMAYLPQLLSKKLLATPYCVLVTHFCLCFDERMAEGNGNNWLSQGAILDIWAANLGHAKHWPNFVLKLLKPSWLEHTPPKRLSREIGIDKKGYGDLCDRSIQSVIYD